MPDSATHAVFLSYAHEDADTTRRIADALRAAGVEVWFDESELRGGDAWDQNIRAQIRDCALFVPIVSTHTQARREGYFRLEWKLADERTHLMAEGTPFVLPVVVDDTKERDALVPKSFVNVQWTRLPRAEAPTAFAQRVAQLLGGSAKSSASRTSAAPQSSATPPTKSSVPGWAWGTMMVAAIAVIAFFATRKSEPPAAPPKPVAETKAASVAPTPVAVADKSAPADKSIAVLPFANRSPDKENEFFTDGVHEDVLTNLFNIRELRVVSRTSVEQYRGTTKSMKQIGAELGVTYILEGSVQRVGNKVHVTGQLIDARTDTHLWAKAYDKDLSDIFVIQAELAKAIAAEMQTVLSPEEKKLVERKLTENPKAYDLYLRERALRAAGQGPKNWQQRRELLEQAVALDPRFAKAWAALVEARLLRTTQLTPQQLAEIKAALDTLTNLAPDAPETAWAQAAYFANTAEPAQALVLYQNFARMWPQSAAAAQFVGLTQRNLDRWAEAIGSLRRAILLDPIDPALRRDLIVVLLECRRLHEALLEEKNLVALLPKELAEGFQLGRLAYNIDGSTREMDRFFARVPRVEWDQPAVVLLRMQWAQLRGDHAEAARLGRAESGGVGIALAALAVAVDKGPVAAQERLAGFLPGWRKKRETFGVWNLSTLALMEAITGNSVNAQAQAADLERLLSDLSPGLQLIFRAQLAAIHAWAGEKDRALLELSQLLQEAGWHLRRLPEGDDLHTRINVHELRTALEFSPLQGDPRFEALLNDPKNNAPLF